MGHTADLNGFAGYDKEESIVSDPKPELLSPLECLHIALACLSEAMQRRQNAHSCGFIEPPDIGFRRFGPNNPLHRALL
jgi:hypothetical protein